MCRCLLDSISFFPIVKLLLKSALRLELKIEGKIIRRVIEGLGVEILDQARISLYTFSGIKCSLSEID